MTPSRDVGRELFKEGNAWRYRWSATTGTGPTETGAIECRVRRVTDWIAGVAADLECDGNLADVDWNPSFDPIGGVWAGGDDGIWRLESMPTATGSSPYELFLEPAERSETIESMGAPVGTLRMYRRDGMWCRREDNPSVPWRYELCFDGDRIVRGELHTEDKYGERHMTFELDE